MKIFALSSLAGVVLLGCQKEEKFSFSESPDKSVVYRCDKKTGETWVSRHGGDWRKLKTPEEQEREEESARLEREAIVRQIRLINEQHPERFRRFAKEAKVTILSGDPRETLRGMAARIQSGPYEITDPRSSVAWKLRYDVRVGSGYATTNEYVDAEFLALEGSREEEADLSITLPRVWSKIQRERQDRNLAAFEKAQEEVRKMIERENEEKAAAVAREREAQVAEAAIQQRDRDPSRVQEFHYWDQVEIRNSDPRPELRGRRGRVASSNPDNETVRWNGRTEVVRRRYTVDLETARFEVYAEHLVAIVR